uniref:Uncharacterized protein n=1 Tax=Romanomermis culicivorax TaxID=13658 RepID=A0A915JQR2_ROMCU
MNKLTTFPDNDDKSLKNERYSNFKTLSLILRFFNRLSSISTSTGYYLIKEDLAYHLAKFLNPQEKFYQANLEVVKIILDILLKLLPADYCNFPEQLIRAQACEEILVIATRKIDVNVEEDYSLKNKVKKSAQDLLFSCIREHSDLRIDLSKFGVVEYLRDVVSSKCTKLSETCFLLLCKFCSDGFIRVKLRSSDTLRVLLDFFRNLIILEEPSSETFRIDLIGELINAFSSFSYDENGLECILKWRYDNTDDNLLSLYAKILEKFTEENLCPASHTSENDEKNDNLKRVKSCDSLSNKKHTHFRKNFANEDMNFYKSQAGIRTSYSFSSPSGGYSPPAPGSAYASPCYSPPAVGLSWAPNNGGVNQYPSYISPNRASPPGNSNFVWSPSPCHNLELCWSPTYSAAGARSPATCSDTPLTYDRYSDVVDDDDGNTLTEFENSEWFSDLAFAKNVKVLQAKRLCQCTTYSSDSNGTVATKTDDQQKNVAIALEATVNKIIYFLSVLSHSEKLDENLSQEKRVISAILEYLSQTCRPQPRAGRLLKRLARERRLTESLLNLEFHKFVRRYLCTYKCLSDPICSHCRKLCRIGCDIMLSFRMQVDADFGSGILAHKILNDSGQDDSLKFVFAIPYLIKNRARRKKFLLEYNCLERIIELLLTKSDQNVQSDAFDSLKELISLSKRLSVFTKILKLI